MKAERTMLDHLHDTTQHAVEPNLLASSDHIHCGPRHAVYFGPFKLIPRQRLLLKGDEQVQLGSRALDILIALTERPGELISKNELMARVWPGLFVEPANLTVHIAALRRALEDGVNGNRFVVNVPGRGYCFTAHVEPDGLVSLLEERFRSRDNLCVRCRKGQLFEKFHRQATM
jgi:DNA-binding winged helix-turn-helix (wHTH) protein